jgi:hypothetical protein
MQKQGSSHSETSETRVLQLCLKRDSRDSFLAKMMFTTLLFHQQNDNKLAFFRKIFETRFVLLWNTSQLANTA